MGSVEEEKFEKHVKSVFDDYDSAATDISEMSLGERTEGITDLMRRFLVVSRNIPKDVEWKDAFFEKWTAQFSKRLFLFLLHHNDNK